MQGNQTEIFQKAKNYTFLLLKFRPRSEKELYERLQKKKFPQTTIRDTLTYLKEHHFINDVDFAKSWIESRLKKPLGLRKIKAELRLKGIDKAIIDNQIESIKPGYHEEDIIAKIARLKFSRLKGTEPEKIKRRIYAYLIRRGFSPEIVDDVIKQL